MQEAQSTTSVVGANSGPIMSWGDVGTTLVMLIVVLAVILALAHVVKRFHLGLPKHKKQDVQVVSTSMVGPKERVVVVQVADVQLVLGVTAQQVSLLKELPKPKDPDVQA
ncbi:flagellar biosynthetic protein FliO [Aliidiomarina taiwanensis]|uniref:Flagellar protein n=1 Tax=Aliidiomarina taiwanensis TaxID=946228 RepID=A0A432WZ38_9GAMM|nr:flagellar biosynthetic protein FliO [Aliidiomarina taiwanensis]RUO39039.1 flagellar biosynthetic protein FliO [Aliidiomarina taiwanensis]